MLNLSLNELKQIWKIRGIKGYKSMPEDRLVSSLNESKSVKKSEKSFDRARIEKIKKILIHWEIKKLKEIEKAFLK